ncbi:NlpC/P60 family protein [Arthrobacter subterraneus]|uniref:NlpC/P60 family protein n=1 Tax=Arthrobacter subterraneus TaxID=335973 RepID=UPI001FE004EE|nr:NlpC/P60 family protein [Arthrobacter subterraneus]
MNAGSAGRQTAVLLAASGLVLTAGMPAHATGQSEERALRSTELTVAPVQAEVTAAAGADISFERQAVSPVAAPNVEEAPAPAQPSIEAQTAQNSTVNQVNAPVVESAQAAPAAPEPAPAASATAAAPAVTETAPTPRPAPAASSSSSSVGAALVASAYAQMGATQDCTILVEVALRSIGKSVGDLAPEQFYQYGTVVGSPVPGDLVIRPGHVAIYVGNGQVISSGMNGVNATILHPLSDLAGSSFVRVSG